MGNNTLLKRTWGFFLLLPIFVSCEKPATSFDEVEDAIYYEKQQKVAAPSPDSSIHVMTWNIRFGIGRGPWFGDACGYKVVYAADEVMPNLKLIADKINLLKPDILLLQEADIKSTRSAYINELRWLLDNTYFNYAVYGSQWKAQFIPSDGLGRMDESNAILSRWPLTNAKRIQLDLRKDQISIERYFYERCCMVRAKVLIPGFEDFYVVNIHASAFATDETKHRHLIEFKEELDRISASGAVFVAGGDLNEIPPGSDSTDFCIEDMCPGESFHHPGDDPMHRPGNNYTPEVDWLTPLFTAYRSAFSLSEYIQNQKAYFTSTPLPDKFWERTLDYLFTNYRWKIGGTVIHQDFIQESDHVPVSGTLILKKK
ncbi:endonuclease/exonuclease/phosphatase family protein [Parabacteroides sp. FAFU027]|uniref:endonuclease/exonuclease/phosphatase family protein n=1 Tax=Parabacteroides sp. FAFU027 TaxID=2922715 RepID=UPI001FAEFA38|nr:endonuclease/exonuclease/phosphatase family protein [Parabacteroides sp. FAFU027]